MKALFSNPALLKVISVLSSVFNGVTKPTLFLLLLMSLAMCALNDCKSIRSMYRQFVSSVAKISLNSLYALFRVAKIETASWACYLFLFIVRHMPLACSPYSIYLVIDDTLIEKFGTHFQGGSRLFDHSAHKGKQYINGHCVASLLVVVPLINADGVVTFVRIPLLHRLWIPKKCKCKDKKTGKKKRVWTLKEVESDTESIVADIPYKSKHQILREMMERVISSYGDKNFVLLADSWYAKGEILDFVNDHANVEAVFSVPVNTALYDVELPKRTGKRGRPREVGDRLFLEDFILSDIAQTHYYAGWRDVTTNLFGKKKRVRALLTESKETKSRRLFICTNPDVCVIPLDYIKDKAVCAMGQAIPETQCFACYVLRWQIEVTYLELKSHWSFSKYMLRSMTGIERLINLQMVVYAVLSILPWIDPAFQHLKDVSIQERRYELGKAINQDLFLRSVTERLQTEGNSKEILTAFDRLAQKMRHFFKTGS